MQYRSCQLHQQVDQHFDIRPLKMILVAGCILLGTIHACYGLSVLIDSGIEDLSANTTPVEIVALLK